MVGINSSDHDRGLCDEPDVPNNTPRAVVESSPAHCRCCGSAMEIHEMNSLGMQQAGMYRLICPVCPSEEERREAQRAEILRVAKEIAAPHGLAAELFPGIQSVGVGGDERTYSPVVNLVGPFPGLETLDLISREISGRTPVNRVTFQITAKP